MSRHLKSLESGLLLLQSLLLLLLVHPAEGYAGGGQGIDRAGQCGRSATQDTQVSVSFSIFRRIQEGPGVSQAPTWCLRSAPWSSCPPRMPGAAPKPPGGCWGPGPGETKEPRN